ncbi:MAG: ATP-binding cassette domain-containing protein, partial [Pseudomonadota bacterium]
MPASDLSALTLTNVSKVFDETRAVDKVTLRIEPGQFVGVIGRSGAGKSTMLRLINRLVDPTQGSISFAGTEITTLKGKALREWRRDCAMIFQQFNLLPYLSVLENITLPGRFSKKRREASKDSAGAPIAEARALVEQLG